jgi:outer membrane receptor for Fe3+-dicitrate
MQCGTMAMNQWCSHTSRSYDGNDFAWTGGQEFVYLITRGIQGQVAQFAVGELAHTFQVGFDTTKHRRSIDQSAHWCGSDGGDGGGSCCSNNTSEYILWCDIRQERQAFA